MHLDAARAFALLLGVVFHASLSFMPMFLGWAVQDVSTSPLVAAFVMISHSFRMELFFLLAGFFGCLTARRMGVVRFCQTRAVRLLVPFVAGWFLLRPLLVSGWIMGSASLRGDYDFWAGLTAGFASLRSLPAGIFTGSHLWFLYYLAMLTALMLVVRGLVTEASPIGALVRRSGDRFVAGLAESPGAWVVLVMPTAAALWFMRHWGMDTPDQTLWPHAPVLMVYGGFFGLGWMLARHPESLERLTRLSLGRGLLAGVAAVGVLGLVRMQGEPSHPAYTVARIGFVVSYATLMWLLVWLTIGLFRTGCRRERPWVRYVADASFWIYLVHLPLVVWLQVAVAEVPLHWSIKLAAISIVTVAACLVTYDLFVRSTWLGALLNGRRRERVLTCWLVARGEGQNHKVASSQERERVEPRYGNG
ncbi:MAG TPA: acyltransferase family protein [Candidatus Synoicihabitans sp.]|nr:acyltransferase family protein [Candidatus Synoicihabitans sp.]